MAHVKLPLIAPNQSMVTTWQSPLKIAIDRAREIEREPGVVAATVLGGFPFSDVPFTGVATIVVTDNDPALAKRYANELASICWERRADFTIHPTPVDDAIAEAMAGAPGSVYVLADISDSGASGTAGDGTAVLEGLLEGEGALGGGRADHGRGGGRRLHRGGRRQHGHAQCRRQARRAARRAGGGDGHGAADPRGAVSRLPGRWARGTIASRGKTVVLEIDGPGGIELQLTELRGHPHDLNFFRAFGIEPTERRILVLKSAAHFRAAFEPIATKVIEVEAPGISSPNLHGFPYQRLRRPIYPLDPDVQWSPE